jgi:hypothetical protein
MKLNGESFFGLLGISVVIALVIKYYSSIDYTITSLAPNFYALTKTLQGV